MIVAAKLASAGDLPAKIITTGNVINDALELTPFARVMKREVGKPLHIDAGDVSKLHLHSSNYSGVLALVDGDVVVRGELSPWTVLGDLVTATQVGVGN